ncbi:hypothetical protein llap_16958 [Limosa lapponica baueri]|uniref:Uncharacterized protein n=1 Tax=Limosa lapponica baueri TaxID=1758121 RepID=A0A2I0TG13_LIMLA|nr:hypothetical protein llap_16958 [Limosa lapponica baueri]
MVARLQPNTSSGPRAVLSITTLPSTPYRASCDVESRCESCQQELGFILISGRDFTNSNEPFVIPEYLRGQLEEFEALREISNSNSYQRLSDSIPHQTCESLYEYFLQILGPYGPMEINNRLLVGEYEHFPEEARKIVEDEGSTLLYKVNHEVADRETNTLPFHPFEMQQGDILRMEKEHQVLKEQLKEAQEKYEQLQSRNSEEIGALKDLLKKSVEETEVSKNELDWLHQDLEIKVKKWQQEKKENQENLKALRNTAKKHTDANDRYLKTIDEKEKQYNEYLNTYLETSNKLANEKVKWEELIKKSEDDCQECVKRAAEAEISVLKNWKETEVCKLNGIAANAEANLKILKSLSRYGEFTPEISLLFVAKCN